MGQKRSVCLERDLQNNLTTKLPPKDVYVWSETNHKDLLPLIWQQMQHTVSTALLLLPNKKSSSKKDLDLWNDTYHKDLDLWNDTYHKDLDLWNDTYHKDLSQRPITKTYHKDLSQRPITNTYHKHLSQRRHLSRTPITNTYHKDLSQRPITNGTYHKDVRPLTWRQMRHRFGCVVKRSLHYWKQTHKRDPLQRPTPSHLTADDTHCFGCGIALAQQEK